MAYPPFCVWQITACIAGMQPQAGDLPWRPAWFTESMWRAQKCSKCAAGKNHLVRLVFRSSSRSWHWCRGRCRNTRPVHDGKTAALRAALPFYNPPPPLGARRKQRFSNSPRASARQGRTLPAPRSAVHAARAGLLVAGTRGGQPASSSVQDTLAD